MPTTRPAGHSLRARRAAGHHGAGYRRGRLPDRPSARCPSLDTLPRSRWLPRPPPADQQRRRCAKQRAESHISGRPAGVTVSPRVIRLGRTARSAAAVFDHEARSPGPCARRMVRAGALPSIRLGQRILVPVEQLRVQFLDRTGDRHRTAEAMQRERNLRSTLLVSPRAGGSLGRRDGRLDDSRTRRWVGR